MTRISLLATAMSLPALNGGKRGLQTSRADDGDENDVRAGKCGECQKLPSGPE